MKKYFLLIIFSIFVGTNAQLHNINPDPNGEPWFVGGLRVPTDKELQQIPKLEVSSDFYARTAMQFPQQLDNSTLPFFRPIFNQFDGSCSQSSGIAYTFTYEINRLRGANADMPENQFPSHYTYDFLNQGSGDNGSFYTDGWNIVKDNGCPTIAEYGGLRYGTSAKYWVSGYPDYENMMDDRVKDYFSIDVSTPEGLNMLKQWFTDHLDGSSTGGIVNFAAGVGGILFNMTDDNIITRWASQVDHAMTFVGWDDTIAYDYNNDGQITNDIDTNNDGVVDMKDWERGALIMVNSWGTGWGDGGKAYVMYRTLALPLSQGGILAGQVFGIHVKQTQNPKLIMKVKLYHDKRNKIQIKAGVASDLSAIAPEHELDFSLFNYQGGEYPVTGINTDPIEISLDVTPLLSYINPNQQAKFFLIVNEKDADSSGSGEIIDFSIKTDTQEFICSQHNINIVNDGQTLMSVTGSVDFQAPEITTDNLPVADVSQAYSQQLNAANGEAPYLWSKVIDYEQSLINENFPAITQNALTPDNYDDGLAVQQLDFEFPFYGKSYSQIYISTDGSLLFDDDFVYLREEASLHSTKAISVFASDLLIDTSNNQGIYYEGNQNYATFHWKTSLWSDSNANVDVAVTLYPDGKIKMFYGDNITNNLDWASGISDGEGNYIINDWSGETNPSNHQNEFTTGPYPIGMDISSDGIFSGTAPDEVNTWNVKFKVTDNNNISKTKILVFETQNTNAVNTEHLQNLRVYPNPAVDFVNFEYELKDDSEIKLSIFDLNGRLIQVLQSEDKPKGLYHFIWKTNVERGIYIYKLQAKDQVLSGKLIVR